MPSDCHFFAILFLASLACGADSFEQLYFRQRALPAVAKFITQNKLSLNPELITNYKVTLLTNANYAGADVVVQTDHVFLVRERRTGPEIWGYTHLRPNIDRVMTSGNRDEMRQLAERTNLLSTTTATAMADHFFTLQGYKPAQFTRTVGQQIVWGERGQRDYIALPFYEFRWTRNDATPSLHESQKPTVRIVVSGITSNLASYGSWIVLKPEDRPTNLVELLMSLKNENRDRK